MWALFVAIYLFLSVLFSQFYKISTKNVRKEGALTVLLEVLAGISILTVLPFFTFQFATDIKIYFLLLLSIIFYAISNRTAMTARRNMEVSTFNILNQVSTVFLILGGILFFKEEFALQKIFGVILVILSNVFVLYEKGKFRINQSVIYSIISSLTVTVSMLLDIKISMNFTLPLYLLMTFLGPAVFILIFERIKVREIKEEFIRGNRKMILLTGFVWGFMILSRITLVSTRTCYNGCTVYGTECYAKYCGRICLSKRKKPSIKKDNRKFCDYLWNFTD